MKEIKKFILKNASIILLICIIIFALFLRTYALGNAPFWIDESISSIASKNILQKGIPLFDSGFLYSRAYLFHYTQAFFLLFGQTEFNARLVSVIFGLLTIVLIYFIGGEYSKSGRIISALFLSVFYLEVFYSRQARFYQLFQFFFFLSIYLLYKSKDNPKYIYYALISFFITLNTQIEGLVLAPFFILHILIYNWKNKNKYLAVIPAIPLIQKFIPAKNLSSGTIRTAANYFSRYASYTANMLYILILFVPGVIWSFIRKKRLTTLIIAPSLIALIGIFTLKTFAFRYAYFFIFPLILYFSLFISFLYEKHGKIFLIAIIALLIIPSNLFFPYTAVNIIKPVSYNINDFSAPEINYKNIPQNVLNEIKRNPLATFYSPGVEWYIKKPDYVFAFSMSGIGDDTISYNGVDVYSGAKIIKEKPNENFYFIASYFAVSKLKPVQRNTFNSIINNCSAEYQNKDLVVYYCYRQGI